MPASTRPPRDHARSGPHRPGRGQADRAAVGRRRCRGRRAAGDASGLPTRKVESYHYTDLKMLLRAVPELAGAAKALSEPALRIPGAHRIPMTNGVADLAGEMPPGYARDGDQGLGADRARRRSGAAQFGARQGDAEARNREPRDHGRPHRPPHRGRRRSHERLGASVRRRWQQGDGDRDLLGHRRGAPVQPRELCRSREGRRADPHPARPQRRARPPTSRPPSTRSARAQNSARSPSMSARR